jgi:hypothetical protein
MEATMIGLSEIKQWLKVDFDDDDSTIQSLIDSSRAIIKASTGVTKDFVTNNSSEELKSLYLMVQRMLINDLYSMRDTNNQVLIGLYTQLQAQYDIQKDSQIGDTNGI